MTAIRAAPETAVLDIVGVSVSFGSLWALRDVDLDVERGQTVGLIGPNGAGKSTLLDVIAGKTRPRHGSVSFLGRDITNLSTHARARAGVRRTFQHLELFEDMTVLENVLVAAESTPGGNRHSSAGRTADAKGALRALGIERYTHAQAGTLPHPVRRFVSYARAVAADPVCLLLDEPVAGLADIERTMFVERLTEDIQRRGLTVVLVEHDMRFIKGLCDTIYVLNAGEVIAHGAFAEIATSDAVRSAYLGEETHD
jgi:ABC-type branched-subunit amino acid transport system ATPase component